MGPDIITRPCNLLFSVDFCNCQLYKVQAFLWLIFLVHMLLRRHDGAFCFIKLGHLVYLALCFLLVKLCGKATVVYSIVQ
jgi:hypothetical protein